MDYTTGRQIPYLEDTDAMSAVPAILQALAERVETLMMEVEA